MYERQKWKKLFHMGEGEWVNPFKPSGAKWLHFKVFRAILV